MTVLINCKDVCLEYPAKVVLTGVALGVNTGERIGVVGRNGDGKSSLLQVLADDGVGIGGGASHLPYTGDVTRRSGTTVGVLAQVDALADTDTVELAVVGGLPKHEWAANRETRAIIDALLGDIAWEALVGSLSGGQRRRVDLARLLIGSWDVLMLDEPTNHLDMQAITWLAAHLKRRWQPGSGALLVVTHDRWFLDEVCLSMWEVHSGQVDAFEGGYSAYILARVEREQQARKAEQKRRNIARKELAWLARGAQARSTKPKFRVKEAQELIANEPPTRNQIELKKAAMTRLGKQVVDLLGASVAYSASEGCAELPVLSDIDWSIGPGDRIGILGENGAGKTTLLKVIGGELAPSVGRVKIGASVRYGYLSQRLDELEELASEQVRVVLSQYNASYLVDGKNLTPAQLLERMGFERNHLMARVCDLSGGQKRRLQLLLTLLKEPNVLILDEPGNDMDTDMLAIMEDLLDSWPGTLILVSHDRYLTERVTDNQYALLGGKLRHVPRGVDEYLELVAQRKSKVDASAPPRLQRERPDDATTAIDPHKLRKQLNSAERKIATLQAKSDKFTEQMHAVDPSDFEQLVTLGQQQQELDQQIAQLEHEWLEMSELL